MESCKNTFCLLQHIKWPRIALHTEVVMMSYKKYVWKCFCLLSLLFQYVISKWKSFCKAFSHHHQLACLHLVIAICHCHKKTKTCCECWRSHYKSVKDFFILNRFFIYSALWILMYRNHAPEESKIRSIKLLLMTAALYSLSRRRSNHAEAKSCGNLTFRFVKCWDRTCHGAAFNFRTFEKVKLNSRSFYNQNIFKGAVQW